jgi:hypothetical protein
MSRLACGPVPGRSRRLAQAFAAQAILAVEWHRQPHVFLSAPAWS